LSPVPLSLPFIVDIGDVDRIYFTVKHSWIVCGEWGVSRAWSDFNFVESNFLRIE